MILKVSSLSKLCARRQVPFTNAYIAINGIEQYSCELIN